MAAKSYSKFTYKDIEAFGIEINQKRLFQQITPVTPTELLLKTIEMNNNRPIATEKAKSEFFITPILNELTMRNNEEITFFSGYTFQVDSKRGLNGMVDFLVAKTPLMPMIKAPIFCIVEAKNDNLDVGVPQCISEMYAAKIFNEQQEKPTKRIYGATTFGLAWRFMCLEGDVCKIDSDIYYLDNLPKLLGVLQFIVDEF